ncbi:hypothetical protein AS159_07695 [Thermotoga sp. Ku-13t]|uniref:hypothetical protein n=1 Tax=Thermotoga sp. Ku-13t TaxID=1755813 RepID=UPI0013E9B9EE|nr:hypothetical protein [Thermotoga sp. Ku-13t]KAF2957539.1 hypothetical protein AS159_07695 [Thermotoga sp. Ku-13t]
MDLEKYARAIEKSLTQIALREKDRADVSEIWIDTSIPVDLIIEIIKSCDISIPQEIKAIIDGNKTIWVRGTQS